MKGAHANAGRLTHKEPAMSTLAVVIVCWLGINVAFVALKLYHAFICPCRGHVSELVENAQLDLHLEP